MAFQQGLSGLNAASKNLDVIGHNVANANTTGFKASRAEFAEAVASAIGSASGQTSGIGVNVAAVTQQFRQGPITNTGNNLDVAINGNGFFVVRQPDGSTAYTRAGNFGMDKQGNLKTVQGDNVMGYPVDAATGKVLAGGQPVPMVFPTGQPIPAKQTTEVQLAMNLDARAALAAGDPSATPPIAPTPRATYGTSISVYDSQGSPTAVNLYFEKSAANQWTLYDKLDNTTSTPPKINPPVGFVKMDNNGKLEGIATPTATDADGFPTTFKYDYYDAAETDPAARIKTMTITRTWTFTRDASNNITGATFADANGAATPAGVSSLEYKLPITVDNSSSNPNALPTYQVSLDLKNLTQYGTKFAVSSAKQDGYTSGTLTGISVSNDGSIVASYSNNVTRTEGQLALAAFTNTQGLADVGNNKWVETANSGPAVNGTAESGTFGSLRSGALEDSNVDLTAELVNMMTAQRFYQANAQTIKTQDQVFSTLVNLR